MNDKLENNKLDDSTLEKVSGGEGNSVDSPEPRYKVGEIVFWRGHGRELYIIEATRIRRTRWVYSIRPCHGGNITDYVEETDISKDRILC